MCSTGMQPAEKGRGSKQESGNTTYRDSQVSSSV